MFMMRAQVQRSILVFSVQTRFTAAAAAVVMVAGLPASSFGQTKFVAGQPVSQTDPAGLSLPSPQAVVTLPSAMSGRLGALSAQPASFVRDPEVDSRTYKIRRLLVTYGTKVVGLPPESELAEIKVVLSQSGSGYSAPDVAGPQVVKSIGELSTATDVEFSGGAISSIYSQITAAFNRIGIVAVVTVPGGSQLIKSGEDIRKKGDTDFSILVYVGEIRQVRTIAAEEVDGQRVDLPSQTRLVTNAPVKVGEPVRIDDLDDYVYRLNRHPGRRVDIAISPFSGFTEKDAQLSLDLLVSEQKPWSVYAQASNTGTSQTELWRERFGLAHTNLTGNDDIFRLDYSTAGFSATHAVNASYEFPLNDRLRLRALGQWSKYLASDLGLVGQTLSGESWEAGGEAVIGVYQHRDLFIDAVVGARYLNVRTTNAVPGSSVTGETNFFLPYVGAVMERISQTTSTSLSGTFEFQSPSVGTGRDQVQFLGRTPADTNWTVFKFDGTHSFFLEPLLMGDAFFGKGLAGVKDENGKDATWQRGMSLAHEVVFSLRGQVAFGEQRLIPNAQLAAGGMYTVRGYPETVASGDSVVVGSLEYRYHVPWSLQPRSAEQNQYRWVPDQTYGRADWDLVLKAFVDAGATYNNQIQTAFEKDQTLVGAGFGVELQSSKDLRGSIRMDLGFPLKDFIEADSTRRVRVGDPRLHVSFLLMF